MATLIIAVIVMGVAGCGDSSSSTISASAALKAELRPVARALKNDPRTLAYEAALENMDGDEDLPELRHGVEVLLPKMTAYVRYLRSLHFPRCLQSVHDGITKLVDESEAMTRASIPVLKTGDRDLAFAYLNKVHETSQEESRAVKNLYRKAEEGGGATC